jgi:hypothetical protein
MEKISAKSELPCSSHEEPNDLPHHSNSVREMENIRTVADDLGKVPNFIRQRRTHEVVRLSHGTAREESGFSSEPLMAYEYDPNLGRHEEVIFTVKTMLQLEKNDHQAELMKSLHRGVFGRDAARPYVLGIVAAFSLANDRLDWSLAEAK